MKLVPFKEVKIGTQFYTPDDRKWYQKGSYHEARLVLPDETLAPYVNLFYAGAMVEIQDED